MVAGRMEGLRLSRARTWPGFAAACALACVAVLGPVAGARAATPPAAGQLFVAGYNLEGQLGDGTNLTRLTTEPAPFLPADVTQVAGSRFDTFALLSNGTVAATGSDTDGALGDGVGLGERFAPAIIGGLANVTQVAAGENYFGLALIQGGAVAAWGNDENGELGNGGAGVELSPVVLPTVHGVSAVAAGCDTGYALLSDGRVLAWGGNLHGQLGDGHTGGEQASSSTPVEVLGLEHVLAIAAGCQTGYALVADGRVEAWGYDKYAQVGNGSTSPDEVTAPAEVRGVSGAVAIAAGTWAGYALLGTGEVVDWGYNVGGELGDGTAEEHKEAETVPGLTGVRTIGASNEAAYAVLESGAAYGWGDNESGELGDGTSSERSSPEALPSLTDAIAFGLGSDNSDLLAIQGAFASLSATSLAFPTTEVGAKSPVQSVALLNRGPAPLTVSADSLQGAGAGDFEKTFDSCQGATIAAGASCTVSLAFTPSGAGEATASLSFATTAANPIDVVALSGLASAPPRVSALRLSPSTFELLGRRVAGRCLSLTRANRRRPVCRRPAAFHIAYGLNTSAEVRYRVQRLLGGVRVGGQCIAPALARGRHPACTRARWLSGSIDQLGRSGNNTYLFDARIGGTVLGAGTYRLIATPLGPAGAGSGEHVRFRIVR